MSEKQHKTKNVPEIRFKGFTDNWEQRAFQEIATMHARIGWQNLRTSEFLDKGEYLLITGTDFKNGYIDYSTCHYVEKERYNQDKNIQIKNGCILITKDGTIGKVAYVQGLNRPATLNAGIFNIEIKNKNIIDEKYLFHYLKAPFLMDYVTKRATGGTIKHLNQNILVEFPILISNIKEQQLIGKYFSILDKIITLHERKLEDLKKIKKSLLQKMFPKNDKKIPEIRFSEFTDAWEQRKLENVVKFYSGLTYSPTDVLEESGTLVLRSSNIKNNQIIKKDNVYVNDKIVNSDNVEVGDIIVVVRNGSRALIGKHAKVKKNMPSTVIGAFMTGIRAKQSDFINSLLDSEKFNIEIQKNLGATINQITTGVFKKMIFFFPNEEEQEKIGKVFCQIDNIVTLHERKLESLKKLKKALLQKMFV